MPVVRPCIVHRCREYATEGGSRCAAHEREFQAGRWDRGLTGHRGSKGTGPGWAGKRRRALIRQGLRCASCGCSIGLKAPAEPFDLHHRDGNARNNDDANLEALCRPCHRNLP